MAQYAQSLYVPGKTAPELLSAAYSCFRALDWTVEYVFESRMTGHTKKNWSGPLDHIFVDVTDENITVTSKLPESATWDLFRKNKKNVTQFLTAWEQALEKQGTAEMEQQRLVLDQLRIQTQESLEKQQEELAKAEEVMNLSSGSKVVTYSILGLNVLVFVVMIAKGVHFFDPSVDDLVKWGGNFKPFTTGGEWWRLLSSMFLHAGIIHLAFNMYALFMVGLYLEPMLGRLRYSMAYLCTGVLASLASIWWKGDAIVSVGASGAIFGLYGVFLALLTTRIIPQSMRNALGKSIGIFVFYNLAYGMSKTGVDNAAHIGGLVSGFAIGYLYFVSLKNKHRMAPALVSFGAVLATVCVTFLYLNAEKNDTLVYEQQVIKFGMLEEKALQPLRTPASDEEMVRSIKTISLPAFEESKGIMVSNGRLRLNEQQKKQRKLFEEYIDLRIRELHQLMNKEAIDQTEAEISNKLEEIKMLGK